MGQFCWVCERVRPNEAFSGRKHGQHLCRECARLPKSVREQKERFDSLWSILHRQRVISPKNIGMAVEWAGSEDPEVARLASIVAEVGRVHPARKRRLASLRKGHPELYARMVAAGVVDDLGIGDCREDEAEIDRPPAHEDARSSLAEGTDGTDRNAAQREEYDEDELPF